MGCWSKTCGLSNLHIFAGTPVYVFILEESRTSSNCYTTSLFSPLLLPFESKYDDYGGGEDSSGIAFDLIIKALKEKLIEMPLGDNQYHDIEVTREKFDEKLFFESIHENRLFVNDYHDQKIPVSFTMMRKDLVDSILAKRVVTRYVGDGKGTCGYKNNYIEETYADVIASIEPLVQQLSIDLKNSPIFYLVDNIFQYRNDFAVAKWMIDYYRFSNLVDIRYVLRDFIKNNKITEAIELLKSHILGVFVESFMDATRKTWIPGGHEGSQSAERDEYRLLIQVMTEEIDKEQAEFDAENDDDDSEEKI